MWVASHQIFIFSESASHPLLAGLRPGGSSTRPESMCGDKVGQKFMTSGQYFEQCENSVKMRAWFEELLESGNIIAKV